MKSKYHWGQDDLIINEPQSKNSKTLKKPEILTRVKPNKHKGK